VKSVPPDVVIEFVDSAGIDLSEIQPLNIIDIFVTFDVLKVGIDLSEIQLLNIDDISVVPLVLNNGTSVNDVQL